MWFRIIAARPSLGPWMGKARVFDLRSCSPYSSNVSLSPFVSSSGEVRVRLGHGLQNLIRLLWAGWDVRSKTNTRESVHREDVHDVCHLSDSIDISWVVEIGQRKKFHYTHIQNHVWVNFTVPTRGYIVLLAYVHFLYMISCIPLRGNLHLCIHLHYYDSLSIGFPLSVRSTGDIT